MNYRGMTIELDSPICKCKKRDWYTSFPLREKEAIIIECKGCGTKYSVPLKHANLAFRVRSDKAKSPSAPSTPSPTPPTTYAPNLKNEWVTIAETTKTEPAPEPREEEKKGGIETVNGFGAGFGTKQ